MNNIKKIFGAIIKPNHNLVTPLLFLNLKNNIQYININYNIFLFYIYKIFIFCADFTVNHYLYLSLLIVHFWSQSHASPKTNSCRKLNVLLLMAWPLLVEELFFAASLRYNVILCSIHITHCTFSRLVRSNILRFLF